MMEYRATGRMFATARSALKSEGGRMICTFQLLDAALWKMENGVWNKLRDLKDPLPCVAYDGDAKWTLDVKDGAYLEAIGVAIDSSSIGEDYKRQRDKWFYVKTIQEQGSTPAKELAGMAGIKAALDVLALSRKQQAEAMAYLFGIREEDAARLLAETGNA